MGAWIIPAFYDDLVPEMPQGEYRQKEYPPQRSELPHPGKLPGLWRLLSYPL